jgi:phosphinothricin acetyltransferase
MIHAATSRDADAIAAIYNFYIASTTVTFEETELPAAEIAARIKAVGDAGYPWLAFERDGAVLGYAYAGRFAARSAYRLTAEGTVYVAPDARGAGIGTQLYRELIDRLRAKGAHCVLGIIALPNEPSVRLHEKLGFVKVADLKEIGRKFERWIDVGYWQLFL